MNDLDLEERKNAFKYLFPLFCFLFLFIFLPVSVTFITAFTQDISFLPKKFIFLKNYALLFEDAGFWRSLYFTILFILVSVPLELLLGLAFALILNVRFPLHGILRALLLIPWAIPSAISARLWQLIYHYHYGLANYLLLNLGLSNTAFNWLGREVGAFCAVVFADVWKTVPFVAIILLAGLQAIPPEIYKQAKLDQADFLKIFFKITLPLLKPYVIVALLFRTIDALRVFDIIYVLTGGGPGGATTSLSLYAYKFFLNGDFGYGSAVAVVLFIISFLLALLYLRFYHIKE